MTAPAEASPLTLATVTGRDVVRGMNELFDQKILREDDVSHFAERFDEWLGRVRAGDFKKVSMVNWEGKKTRVLLHLLGLPTPRNKSHLAELLGVELKTK